MSAPEKRDANLVSLLWAGPETAADIAGLHAQLFPDAWDTAAVGKLLEHPGATTLLARTGFPKASVGFAMAQIGADEAEILSIGVLPDWRRVGLGKRLVTGVERSLIRAGVKKIFLEVAEDNQSARGLYVNCGFGETGRRKAYYVRQGRPAVDALVLSKAI